MNKTREYFENALNALGLKYPKQKIDEIVEDSRGIIYKLKYYYNRPRPNQIAKALGLKFHEKPLKSTDTPAYPSGHSTQGRLIAKYLSDLYPGYSKEIMKIGEEVSKSRMIAKVHYKTDSEFGIALGDALYKHYKNKLTEVIKIPIEVGDVVLGGKFKNKKITVKSIGTNEKGDVTINGKSILRVRPIPKLKEMMKEGIDRQEVVDRVYPLIVKNLGRAKRGTPKVEFHTNIYARLSGDQQMTGEANPHAEYDWDKNKIYLYTPKMVNEKEIIKSLLHEYTHATQDRSKMEKYRELGYDKNPYEKAAHKAEKNWKKYL